MKLRITTILLALSLFLTLASWEQVRGVKARVMPATPMATLTVTNTNDSGAGSLRQAIADAMPGDTINIAVTGTITLTTGLTRGRLIIDKSLTINGPGANLLTISGNQASRVILILGPDNNVTLSGLTIANGNAGNSDGGGVSNGSTGTVNLDNCAVVYNSADVGGGVDDGAYGGTLNISNCTIANNTAREGGGIHLQQNTTRIVNSTIAGNTATGPLGGGISNFNAALTITNSTITGNSSVGTNGFGSAGGVLNIANTTTVKNTIIAGNSGEHPDVGQTSSSFLSDGYNLIGKRDGATGFGVTGDKVGTKAAPLDPKVAPLRNYGGPTQTCRLLPGSPAIDAGAAATDPTTGLSLITDQRGFPRPLDLSVLPNAAGGDASDIGAVEMQNALEAICQNVTVTAGSDCTATITADQVDNGSFNLDTNDSISLSLDAYGPFGFGTHNLTLTATDSQGATSSCTATVTVTPSCPANIVAYLPANSTSTGMVVTYPATTVDNCSDVTTTPPSGSFFPVGTTTVTVTGGVAGNQATCNFTVTVLYNFSGFFQPVDNLPAVNVASGGTAIPVKFSLSGYKGMAILAAGYPSSQPMACYGGVLYDIEQTVTAGSSSLSYDATTDTYIYVWKTDRAWRSTCRQLVVKLNDGTTHTAFFQFR